MIRRCVLTCLVVPTVLGLSLALAAAPENAADEWKPLFNGKDLAGWQSASGGEPGKGWVVEDGVLFRKDRAGDVWTKERYGDFVLDLEFKTTGNSGVFIRTDNPKDNVQTGIEVQVDNPSTPGKHSCGAVYDCLAPSKMVARKDEWNRMVIKAQDNRLGVEMNGEAIVDMDLNQWSEARKNPDGSKNKFRTALKDFKREGHIGFQDHGAAVMYRNVKIKPLTK
jgi:hypothetical protein